MTKLRTLRRVVVTGATGFIGTHLTRALTDLGATVIAVDRRPPATDPTTPARPSDGVLHITADLRDCALEPLLLDADTLIHLAGQPGVRTSWAHGFTDHLADNLLVTHRLAESAAALGVSRLVLASSSSIYGPTNGTPSKETDPPRPISPYAISKLAAEQLWRAHTRQTCRGMHAVALRYFTVYGPGQRPDMLIHRALTAVRTGEPIKLFGSGHQQRDFTYVHDAVQATIATARCPQPPTVINIGSGHTISLTDLFATIAETTGHRVPTIPAPAEHGDVTATLADTTLAHETLGWRPGTPLARGITEQWVSLT